MASHPKLVSCLIPSGLLTAKPYGGDRAQFINKHVGSAALHLPVSLGTCEHDLTVTRWCR